MSLNLRGTPVVSRRTAERNQKALDILEEIQEQVARMGLPEYPKPTSQPRVRLRYFNVTDALGSCPFVLPPVRF